MEKNLSLATRLFLLGAGILGLVVGPFLYFFPYHTQVYFAWTIKHPLTPVFMGTFYLAGFGTVWAMRLNRWSVARLLFPGLVIFSTTMLVATLLHLNIFNWSHPVAWGWMAVYVISPVLSLILWVMNERDYRPVAPAGPGLPPLFAPFLFAVSIIYALVGLSLFFFPTQVAPLWPWFLTPLTARVIGGWLLATAAWNWMLAKQHAFDTAHLGVAVNIAISFLLLIGALMHLAEFNGPSLSILLYMLSQILVAAYSTYTWYYAYRQSITMKAAAR